MGRDGTPGGLLADRHAADCDGEAYSRCQAIGVEGTVAVVLMVWCGDCNAAAYRLIPTPGGGV